MAGWVSVRSLCATLVALVGAAAAAPPTPTPRASHADRALLERALARFDEERP